MAISTLLSRRSAITLIEVFRLLLTERYSGSVIIHFAAGHPRKLEYGPMYQIPIYAPDPTHDRSKAPPTHAPAILG